MTKYYYDDELSAAWMKKHHGFLFSNENAWIEDASGAKLREGYVCRKYYIHPDSLPLLEAKDGDVYWYEARDIDSSFNDVGIFRTDTPFPNNPSGVLGIAERNGIPFHWPKKED